MLWSPNDPYEGEVARNSVSSETGEQRLAAQLLRVQERRTVSKISVVNHIYFPLSDDGNMAKPSLCLRVACKMMIVADMF